MASAVILVAAIEGIAVAACTSSVCISASGDRSSTVVSSGDGSSCVRTSRNSRS